MKRVGLVGLGTITKNYLQGLQSSSLLCLAAVCDISLYAIAKDDYAAYPFYNDYREMIEIERLDYVIISTTPDLHFDIAMWALTHNTNVIVEKPATVNIEQYNLLLKTAWEQRLIFKVMFHWQFGEEILRFNQLFDAKKIEEIHVEVYDAYCQNGIDIDDNKVNLMGTWLDSGVNILSMLKLWLPFENICIKSVETQKCTKTQLPVYIKLNLTVDGVRTEILIDWRKNIDRKLSYLIYDGRKITIDHSAQKIIDGEKIISCVEKERLIQHYYNYFKNYNEHTDEVSAVAIHKILFEVNERL